MGLKNKADTLNKVPLSGILPGSLEESDYYTHDDFNTESAKLLDALKKKGKIDKVELFKQNGFSFEREISAGEHHFGLIFKKI